MEVKRSVWRNLSAVEEEEQAFRRDTPQAQRSVARHVCHTSARTRHTACLSPPGVLCSVRGHRSFRLTSSPSPSAASYVSTVRWWRAPRSCPATTRPSSTSRPLGTWSLLATALRRARELRRCGLSDADLMVYESTFTCTSSGSYVASASQGLEITVVL